MAGPRVTILGGVREIGGSKVVVEDGPDRVLFDFGPSFSHVRDDFYVKFLQPRSTTPVKDLLEFQLLPAVEGLYSEEALYGSELKYRAPEYHAVFLSHAHIDHAGHLDLVDRSIPVYVGEGTLGLLRAIEGSGGHGYGNHDWRTFAPGDKVRVGRIEVQPFPVDHSIPWAFGFLVRTSEGTVVYTGDFRAHGPRASSTHQFLAAAATESPAALVLEGTRAGPTDPRRNFSEQGVREAVDHLLGSVPQLATVSCYPRDIDRLTTLYQAAQAAERQFVVSLKTAHLLTTMAPLLPREAPVPGRSDGLLVYRRTKKTYFKWERPFLDEGVDAGFVHQHGPELLLELGLPHFAELIDVRPEAGSPYIHSMSEPFSEDDVDADVLHHWLEHFGLPFHQFHASGHCSATELFQAVREVGPRLVVPIHTEHPAEFEKAGRPVRSPELGVPIELPS